jgi:uncharacterized protein with von Willebrand factor type A (vWA) domain
VRRDELLDRVDLASLAAHLAARLRAAGVPTTAERASRFAAAVDLSAPATLSELYWLARVTLVGEYAHFDLFGRVFSEVFGGLVDPADFRRDAADEPVRGDRRRPHRPESPQDGANPRAKGAFPVPAWVAESEAPRDPDNSDGQEAVVAARSAEERLRQRDFATLTEEELVQLRLLGRAISLAPPTRVSRRRTTERAGRELDVRATLRRARRTGGEPLVTKHRRRRRKPRRLVLICDISGSMEPYARAYLQLLMSGAGFARSETFVFATRLTRLTRALRDTQPQVAMERAGRLAPDWSGGTRIGAAMKSFNDGWGRRGLARGAVVVVLSDGWDTGDPLVLGREIERLRRLAYRVVWVNPRKASPRYTPLAGGMAAALPHVDVFVSGHSRAALDEVLDAISAA